MRRALAACCLALAGCAGMQIYPTLQEQRQAADTMTEEPVMLRTVLERTARDLVARLP